MPEHNSMEEKYGYQPQHVSYVFQPPAGRHQPQRAEGHGEALIRNEDQPGGRRCVRACSIREDAQPNPRPEPGVKERFQWYQFHPDNRGLPAGDHRYHAAHPRVGCSVIQRNLH